MEVTVSSTCREAASLAAQRGAERILRAIRERGEARIVLATGVSQFDMLKALLARDDLDWSKCTAFHLDEYIGLPRTHKASFVKYLTERFVDFVPELGRFEPINGEAEDMDAEIVRLGAEISKGPIDLAFAGIGENGHLAFNDPPADFDATAPYLRVALDRQCRRQQVNEGWFAALDDVPSEAITMSIRQIMAAEAIVCTVPDKRKARAVKATLEGEIDNLCPASILRRHEDASLFLDEASASELTGSRESA